MRSITFVQAFQYWLKLTAVAVPALALAATVLHDRPAVSQPVPPRVSQITTVAITTDVVVAVTDPAGVTVNGRLDGAPVVDRPLTHPGRYTLDQDSSLRLAEGAATPVVAGTPTSGGAWLTPGGGFGASGNRALYQVLSLILATFLGAMGLPHVLVRFYTNPDGRSARRTALTVILLLSLFYLFPILLGILARLYVPQLLITGSADAAVLLLPTAVVGGLWGSLLAALVAAGAIAAFLSTSSGLLISVAGALSTDVLRGRISDFRWAAVIGGVIPIVLAVASTSLELSRMVGLVFAVAASTLCPLLVLGIWWRRLTAAGAISGLVVGGLTSGIAAVLAISGVPDSQADGWSAVIIGYPAAVTVPLAFATTIVVSLATAARKPSDAARIFARMHVPERLGMGVERLPAAE